MSIKERSSGILMHISSLPSEYGIGKLGKEAFRFIDFLARSGVKYWQILPLSPTSYGDSPYQSFSVHAGNPYFIDFEALEKKGLLKRGEYSHIDWGTDPRRVNYNKIYLNCFDVLRKAYERAKEKSKEKEDEKFKEFKEENEFWLKDYALFMALKDKNGGKPWYEWRDGLSQRMPSRIEEETTLLKEQIGFYSYIQYIFFQQWQAVLDYAHKKGIRIIGDIPIYVALDSVEVWTKPELFQLQRKLTPKVVAGCPPDDFSPTGQLWGNPIYNWRYHSRTDFEWWRERFEAAKKFYDVIRIDHFRGFESYYAIPYGEKTAENGEWIKGPGKGFFNALKDCLDETEIIAEDLGFLTEDVRKLLEYTGYPGMKVLQFAFGGDGKSEYMPHNFKTTNCIAYTGTHDNETLSGWISGCSSKTKKFIKRYFRVRSDSDIPEAMIRAVWGSVANLAIAQIQDFLSVPPTARMNTPSTLGGNWEFRTVLSDFSPRLSKHIQELNDLYNR